MFRTNCDGRSVHRGKRAVVISDARGGQDVVRVVEVGARGRGRDGRAGRAYRVGCSRDRFRGAVILGM